MKAVILAGGLGTRLSEETATRPKPMVEIGGKPILWHIMKMYSHHGINDFIVCCGYKGYVIKEYFANYFLHMSDVTFDMQANTMHVHEKRAEPWKVTLVDTGDESMTGGRLARVANYVKDEEAFCFTYGDGVADVLGLYDLIVGEYFDRTDTEVVLATGLAQKPYDRVKFYYRLNTHADFLRGLGIAFSGVFPRMTRDFLIEFENDQQAQAAHNVLAAVRVLGGDVPLFGEIDNRGTSLFVTLTYPHEITHETQYQVGDFKAALLPEVSFVAIKNGMHQEEGFAFFSPGAAKHAPTDKAHVAQLAATIHSYFNFASASRG